MLYFFTFFLPFLAERSSHHSKNFVEYENFMISNLIDHLKEWMDGMARRKEEEPSADGKV